jgi:hypothetical protein
VAPRAAQRARPNSPPRWSGATDSWTLQILQGRQEVDLNGDISLEALARAADPDSDYEVEVATPNGEALTFRASDLSEGHRNQFRAESAEQ